MNWSELPDLLIKGFLVVLFTALAGSIAFVINKRWDQKKEKVTLAKEAKKKWFMPNGLPPANISEALQQAKREGHDVLVWQKTMTTLLFFIIIGAGIALLTSPRYIPLIGLSEAEIKATAQAEIYKTATKQAEQAAIITTQTAMALEIQALAMTQTGMAMPTVTLIPTETPIPVSENTSCPLYVYQDWSTNTKFVPEGFMGDISDIDLDDNFLLDTNRPNVIKISYMPKGEEKWAGVYWWIPGTNWGNGDDVGLDISCASKLTFWARGENGGEKAEFKVGGMKGTYSDSLQPAFSSGILTLTSEWRQYTIDLTGKDLSHVMGGFVWVTQKPSNPTGATIYLDDIRFE